jgi:hypothetical protein
MSHRKKSYEDKNVILNGNFHMTLHSLLLQALRMMEEKSVG